MQLAFSLCDDIYVAMLEEMVDPSGQGPCRPPLCATPLHETVFHFKTTDEKVKNFINIVT